MYDTSVRSGRKYKEQNSSAIKSVLEWSCPKIDELSSSFHKKKLPVLPEKVHQKLYGIPGENIFTYGLDEPKPRKKIIPQIDVGMVPKEDSSPVWRCITRLNTAFKDSLDKSLIPRNNSGTRLTRKTILNRDHISHLKNDLVNMEEKTDEFKPKIGANLVIVSNKISRRKQFTEESRNQFDVSKAVFDSFEDEPSTSGSDLNLQST
ncbi:hypothetical protein MACK_003219 [Theileria orientalis]|uniref:Uncharacterized protein n=1 Tax=Theileria orientalis TaxID=68886 RepID=A0A976SIB2_THEOR|nr:hypothetical protein MACK_003219 [Theileria orientalis]